MDFRFLLVRALLVDDDLRFGSDGLRRGAHLACGRSINRCILRNIGNIEIHAAKSACHSGLGSWNFGMCEEWWECEMQCFCIKLQGRNCVRLEVTAEVI